jgi:hypothetical protein
MPLRFPISGVTSLRSAHLPSISCTAIRPKTGGERSVIRVYLLPGPVVFDLVVAAVLIPLGTWLALTRPAPASTPGT